MSASRGNRKVRRAKSTDFASRYGFFQRLTFWLVNDKESLSEEASMSANMTRKTLRRGLFCLVVMAMSSWAGAQSKPKDSSHNEAPPRQAAPAQPAARPAAPTTRPAQPAAQPAARPPMTGTGAAQPGATNRGGVQTRTVPGNTTYPTAGTTHPGTPTTGATRRDSKAVPGTHPEQDKGRHPNAPPTSVEKVGKPGNHGNEVHPAAIGLPKEP